VSVQDRCTVCAKHTIGSEIILHAQMKLQGNVGLMASQFVPFGYSVTFSLFGDSGNVDSR
jgi:hypothetical protein